MDEETGGGPPGQDQPPPESSEDEYDEEWVTNPTKALIKMELLEYCENTTVHGFTYIPNGKNMCEKVLI